jgi:sialic acid synthase SpsE
MSDHTIGIMVPCAAAAMGAVAVEKHVTLDRHMKGTDHIGALDPPGMSRLVTWIRNFEKARGDGIKSMLNSEFSSKNKLARSIVASRDLLRGEVLKSDMITTKTATTLGTNPFDEDLLLGKVLKLNLKKDDLILLDHVEK